MCKLLNQIITLPVLFIIFSVGMSNFAYANDLQIEKRSTDMWIETYKTPKVAPTKERIITRTGMETGVIAKTMIKMKP